MTKSLDASAFFSGEALAQGLSPGGHTSPALPAPCFSSSSCLQMTLAHLPRLCLVLESPGASQSWSDSSEQIPSEKQDLCPQAAPAGLGCTRESFPSVPTLAGLQVSGSRRSVLWVPPIFLCFCSFTPILHPAMRHGVASSRRWSLKWRSAGQG